jgi:hypothetical protein
MKYKQEDLVKAVKVTGCRLSRTGDQWVLVLPNGVRQSDPVEILNTLYLRWRVSQTESKFRFASDLATTGRVSYVTPAAIDTLLLEAPAEQYAEAEQA